MSNKEYIEIKFQIIVHIYFFFMSWEAYLLNIHTNLEYLDT